MTGSAVTGLAYIGKHRQESRTGTFSPPGSGPDGALAAQVIVIAKEPVPA